MHNEENVCHNQHWWFQSKASWLSKNIRQFTKAQKTEITQFNFQLGSKMAKFGTVSKDSLRTTVYSEIRDAILNGDFMPGEVVKIKQIAEQMGLSPTPVRDALLQLVMERILTMPSSREIRVPVVSKAELAEIQSLRILLEGNAAEVAAEKVTETEIKRLEDINTKIEKSYERGKTQQALSHNRSFHAFLYSCANMPVQEDILDRLWLRMSPMIVAWSDTADVHDFTDHHYDVLKALKAKNGCAARTAISDDISLGGQKIISATKHLTDTVEVPSA